MARGFYTFQQSIDHRIGSPADTSADVFAVKATSEGRARKKLGRPPFGRVWVLVRKPEGQE